MMSGSKATNAALFFIFVFFMAPFKLRHCMGKNGSVCPEIEKKSLLSFKQSLEDPSHLLSSWDGEVDCCKWKGVVCNNLTGHVHQLHLQGDYFSTSFQLSGKISPSLLHLKHLRYLDLSQNHFGETIPSFIGSFTELEYLDLSWAGFYGKIPHNIGNLSNLHTLDLNYNVKYDDHGNYQSLDVDSLEWLSGLSQLEYLNMNDVNLSKADNWAQAINSLPSLVELHFSSCSLDNFTAPLHDVNITSLTFLDLSFNKFQSSAILRWIFRMSNLLFLDFHASGLGGPIPATSNATKLQYINLLNNGIDSRFPDWVCYCKDLEYVNLSFNLLYGTIPNAIANSTSLSFLDLTANQLSGKIPRQIADLCKLESLFLSYNKLEGDIPDSFGNMSKFCLSGAIPISIANSLKYLSLRGNKLTGNLPESLAQLFNLEQLYIDHNMLEGVVTESHFANLTKLEALYASGNHLTLNVSPNWIPPFQLRVVGLGSWNLGVGSQIPSWLETRKNIRKLDLSNTGISGSVPSWVWETQLLNLSHNDLHGKIPNIRATYIQCMYLSSNQFTGSLPRIGDKVMDLDLSNNSFSGGISHFLCDKTNESYGLRLLDLEGNRLSGELPDCWMKWPSLMFLNLANNNMVGSIPNSIGSLANMKSLNLHGNKFSGQIPFSVHNCTNLMQINLADNDLDGSIPKWMGTSLVNLRILILRSNKLNGKIPSEICHLESLQILDLSNNQFSGIIPRCVSNFTAMATKRSLIEYSYSSYLSYYGGLSFRHGYLHSEAFIESAAVTTKGMELHYDTILSLVTSIDLSKNNLIGDIPKELTSLVELRSLNLSGNHLTGSIPNSIGDMKQLESLDLSGNSLSGQIPNSFTLMSSLNYLNLSYNKLTGKIPESTQILGFNASSFIGNNLCGLPLPSSCSRDGEEVHGHDKTDNEDESDESEIEWLYVFVSLGYAVGFSAVCTALALKKSWREAYFGLLEYMWNKLYVYFCVKWRSWLKKPSGLSS